MVELFAISGFGGEFHCSVHRPVNGNPAVQGLKLKPHKFGVLIEANYGKRDDILQFSVIAPQDPRDPSKFLEILKKGQEALANEEEDEALARRASYGRGGDSNFSAESESYRQKQRVASTPAQPVAPQLAPVAVPAPAATPPAVASPAQKPETGARSVPFYKDATSLHLFMEELEKHATPDGVVTRTNCTNVLSRDLSIKGVSTGAVLRGIIGDGHLTEVVGSDELLRFGGMWLTAWQNKNGQTEKEASPPQTSASPTPEVSIDFGALLSNIDRLTDEAVKLRTRRGEISTALSDIEPKIARMKTELEALESQAKTLGDEHTMIGAQLADPKYAEAEGQLSILQKLRDKKI